MEENFIVRRGGERVHFSTGHQCSISRTELIIQLKCNKMSCFSIHCEATVFTRTQGTAHLVEDEWHSQLLEQQNSFSAQLDVENILLSAHQREKK